MKHLYLATPNYAQSVCGGYATSMQMTLVACTKAGIVISGPDFKGGPYVEANRNWLVNRFLASSADAIMFLDDDLTWDENAVVRLYESGLDLCGGVYPFKADKEGYPVQVLNDQWNGYREVQYLPGGFMLIRRKVFEALKPHVKTYLDANHNGDLVHAYFENVVYDGKAWCGEDVEFCNRWHLRGGRIWLWPDIDFGHQGPKVWTGNYAKFKPQTATVDFGEDGTVRVA